MSASKWDYEVAVIGGGSAGFAAARTAAAKGLKTALVEGAEQMGGLCILRGCMPTKALLYASEVMHLARHSNTWGIRAEEVSFNFKQVMARKNAMIQDFADYRVKQLHQGKFKLVRARARFTGPHTLALDNGGQLTAAHFVICTGSTHAPCPIPQLQELGCMNSDTALELTQLPRSLIVLGGGAVALEFAQFFARFGVRVTMIQRSAHVLQGFDTDAAEVLETVFRREGIKLYTGTKLTDARRLGEGKQVTFEHEGKPVRVHADEVFYALGRLPLIAGLGLEHAGVQVEHSRIVTDQR
ncbi:NAD(P)/FAD-dependent oxidoreductase, partial [bacterium]|nr:NAD(P)/FAD-dependent oxidoreductase [bacterium]